MIGVRIIRDAAVSRRSRGLSEVGERKAESRASSFESSAALAEAALELR